MNNTVEKLNSYIEDISTTLGSISNGDFTATSSIEYNGDFVEIKNSINKITSTLSAMMRNIHNTSKQVHSRITSYNVCYTKLLRKYYYVVVKFDILVRTDITEKYRDIVLHDLKFV